MSILLAFQGAPPAEPDLIEIIAVFDSPDEFEGDLCFVSAPIEDAAAPALIESAATDDPVPDAVEVLSIAEFGLIEDDAPILLVAVEPEQEDEETPEPFFAADIFLPDAGGEEIVIWCDFPPDEDEETPESFASHELIEAAFVADPGEVLEIHASAVFIAPDPDPNTDAVFVDGPVEDAPAAAGGDDYLIRARRRGRR